MSRKNRGHKPTDPRPDKSLMPRDKDDVFVRDPPYISPQRECQVTCTAESFSGPLPPPNVLREYNSILPGLANRIVAMAEAQSSHRQRLEQVVINSDCRRSWGGLVSGLIVALFGLAASAYVISQGHDWAGVAIGGATLASMVGSFLWGTHSRKAERLQKAGASAQKPADEKREQDDKSGHH